MVVSFEVGEGSIEHFPARHDDNVEAGSHFVTPEELSGQTLGSVTSTAEPIFACRRHAEPSRRAAVGSVKTVMNLPCARAPVVVDALELRPAANTLGRLAAPGRSCRLLVSPLLTLVGNGQSLTALCPATLQDNSTVLRGHPDPESVGLFPATGVGLVGALAFHADPAVSGARLRACRAAEFSILVVASLGVSTERRGKPPLVLQSRTPS